MTYSVLLRDAVTGALGVGVQSRFFAVGSVVPWARSGVGVVATQAFPDVRYGPAGLAAMERGHSAAEALSTLLADDPSPGVRQVAMLDAAGTSAVHTGENCIPAGGDARGRQAAALLVVSGDVGAPVLVDLRVDDSADPLGDLARLLTLHGAMGHLQRAFVTPGAVFGPGADESVVTGLAAGDTEVSALQPGNAEFLLWQTVVLARAGQADVARAAFARALDRQPELGGLPARLAQAGLLTLAAAERLGG
ncbi:DUF1028 domain-containing protein [Amycolatopsis jejuensis]|uniref:DUF1028 domain-containing protein n=1 Tax=Amycolatopsis jejuensis TaxID=330084 RepID=UPI00068FB5C7|nr:DUF1028 domain-containing protein [Amycolatopsis jejuensis]